MRVQVNLSEQMVERINNYAEQMGVSRSALCSMLISQGIMSYDKSFDMIQSLDDRVGDDLSRLAKNQKKENE